MWLRSLLVRFVCNGAMAAWVGGFMFYGGVVIPTLHDRIGVSETAGATRIVTNWLNAIGGGAILLWIAAWIVSGRSGPARERWIRPTLLAASLVLLVGLAYLHYRMDRILDSGRTAAFYRFHRFYLMASTAQWLANLGLLAIGPADRPEIEGKSGMGTG